MTVSTFERIKGSFFQMITGESVTFLATFLAAYFYALILGPNDYGIWQTARVFISYSIVFTLSLPFVMRRDFVMLRAEGKFEEAQNIANLVFTYELFVTPVLASGVVLYSVFCIHEYLLKISMITVGIIYFCQFLGGYSNILAKGLNNYKLQRNASLLAALLTLLSVPTVYFWGIKALLISAIVISVTNSIYYFYYRPFNYKIFWDNRLFRSLLLISFPLYLQDISSTIFDSIDRLVIAKYLDFPTVGYYSLSALAVVPLRLLISSFSVVLFTQLNERYGYSKADEVIEKHVLIPHKLLSFVIPPLVGIIVMSLPFVVRIFLPKYVHGIVAAQIAMFATFIYLLNSFTANALFVLNKQRKTAVIYFIIGILKTGLCFLSIYLGYGIVGIALSTVIVYLLLDFLMLREIFKHFQKNNRLFIHFAKEFFPVAWVAVGCFLYLRYIISYLPPANGPGQSAILMFIGVLFLLLFSLPIIVKGYRRVRILLYK